MPEILKQIEFIMSEIRRLTNAAGFQLDETWSYGLVCHAPVMQGEVQLGWLYVSFWSDHFSFELHPRTEQQTLLCSAMHVPYDHDWKIQNVLKGYESALAGIKRGAGQLPLAS